MGGGQAYNYQHKVDLDDKHSLEMLTSHRVSAFRVIFVKVDHRGREQGEEDTEPNNDDVTNTRRKGRSTTKVGFLTLKLWAVSPRGGTDVDAIDRDGTSGHG